MGKIELMAPAKNFEAAKTALLCGADAVYVGAEKFSARQAAGNTIDTIKQICDFAHPYYAKVYAAINTVLYDNELDEARKIIYQLYEAGVDGIIIQDMGLLELELPPLQIAASTQTNNDSAEKVKFLEDVGFSRAILARELTLGQIKNIRSKTSIELECFIHGALCVCQSGQCYMSHAIGGRSGNRGQCAQPCRKSYTLTDANGQNIINNKYLLSIKDLNLSDYLEEMIDAGVTSFKIEGRLKDSDYVANVVGFYRRKLDEIITRKNLQKSSSGTVELNFEPNLQKTFNRGYTDYGIKGASEPTGSIDTPKSMGEFIGVVKNVKKDNFAVDGDITLHNGDGICFIGKNGELNGTLVNRADASQIYPQKMEDIAVGQRIYRNYDRNFTKLLEKNPANRKIGIKLILRDCDNGIKIIGTDEDGNVADYKMEIVKKTADKKEQMRQTIKVQLSKFGNTIFRCDDVAIETEDVYFFPVSTLNELRRGIAENLLRIRLTNRPVSKSAIAKNNVAYPQSELTYLGNVLNEKAKAFYKRHGVEKIEPAAESGICMRGKKVMTTKYCLRKQLGLCDKSKKMEKMYLLSEHGDKFRVEFVCGKCGMEIFLED